MHRHRLRRHAHQGFTLLEMSIVLLIIGLLATSIVAGQGFIRASELQSMMTDRERYISAINAFRQRYRALPGDMRNATAYWGVAHATPATCTTTSTGDQRTCNGNGDGGIGSRSTPALHYEYYRAWQQLNNAGLVDGRFTGVTGSGGTIDSIPGTNIPLSRIKAVGPRLLNNGIVAAGDPTLFAGTYKHNLSWGKSTASGGAFMTPEELLSLDTKFDDGKPAYGMIYTLKATALVGCATTDVEATAAYDTTQSGQTCYFGTRTGF